MRSHKEEHRRELERLLNEEHKSLQAQFERLLVKCQEDDRDGMRECWSRFEKELREHLREEEMMMLPGFEKVEPEAVARIREEHLQIRTQLEQLGIDLDLHCFSGRAAEAFGSRLRKHAEYERDVFYPWVAAHVPSDARCDSRRCG